MARWELDKIMELCNCKFKELHFGNNISAWLQHAQNMPLCCKSRAFVENEYSKHNDVDVYTKKYVDGVDISDISQKGNKTRSSVESKRTNEKITCAAILNLGKASVMTPNRKMSTNYFWDLLPLVKTVLVTSKDGEEEAVPDTPLKLYARKVLSGTTSSHNDTTISSKIDMNILNLDVLNALQLPADELDESDVVEDNIVDEVNVSIGINYTVRVRKVPCNVHISCDVHHSGLEKMVKMNLPVVRLRRKQRLNRQKKALRDTPYSKLRDEQTYDNNGVVSNCIMRLSDERLLCCLHHRKRL